MNKRVFTFLLFLMWGGANTSETWEQSLSNQPGPLLSVSLRNVCNVSYCGTQEAYHLQTDASRIGADPHNLGDNNLAVLPGDVLEMIASRLDTNTLLNFRATSSYTASLVETIIRNRSPIRVPLLCLMQNPSKSSHPYPHTISYFIRQGLWKLGTAASAPQKLLKYADFCGQWGYVGESFFRMVAHTEDYKKLLDMVKNWSDISQDMYTEADSNRDVLEIKLWWYVAQLQTGIESHHTDLQTRISNLVVNILEVVHWMSDSDRRGIACFYINELGQFLAERQLTDLAKKMWGVSANYGHPLAQYSYAEVLEQEGHVEVAKEYYRRAANQGSIAAQNSLGVLYMEEENWAEAKKQIQLAADQGLAIAQHNLSIILGLQGDHVNAKKYLFLSASQGYAYAHFNLSMLYDEEGKVQDARKHCKIAADQGIAEAQCNWGVYLYRDGKLEESKLYLQRAADQDHLRAQQNLRELFE